MITSEQTSEIVPAFIAFQSEVETASKDSTNPHFKSKYADLTSIWEACRSYLAKHQLAVIQSPSYADGRIILTTRIFHKSGQWIQGELSLKPVKDDPQASGSTITYARRYTISSMLGIVADEDDDGSTASKQSNEAAENTRLRAKINQLESQVKELDLKLKTALEKPANIFDQKDPKKLIGLQNFLKDNKIADDMHTKIIDFLSGKDLNKELHPLIKRVKAGDLLDGILPAS